MDTISDLSDVQVIVFTKYQGNLRQALEVKASIMGTPSFINPLYTRYLNRPADDTVQGKSHDC